MEKEVLSQLKDVIVEDLYVKFRNKSILEKVSFSLDAGDIAILKGPTGSGKSTLMKTISGILETVYTGFSVLGKISIFGLHPKEALFQGSFSYAPQDPRNFFIGRTVSEELKYRGIKKCEAEEFLEKLNVPIKDLSAGEKYKLIVKISMESQARVILLDEPSAFIDSHSLEFLLRNFTEEIKSKEKVAIIAEHRNKLVEPFVKKEINLKNNNLEERNCLDNPLPLNGRNDGKIEVNGLTISKGKKVLLKDVSFKIESGKMVALVGKNGSGKSSLLREIVRVGMGQFNSKVRIRGSVFFIPEQPLYPFFEDIVWNEIKMWSRKRGIEPNINQVIDKLGLNGKKLANPFSLSIGESRCLQFASSLVFDPDILIIDEPTLGLDECKKKNMIELIKALRNKGASILISTHDNDIASIADYKINVEDAWGFH